MPVYRFTFHAYRSWGPDNPRGYVRHTNGLLPRDSAAAARYDADARCPAVSFDDVIQRSILGTTLDVCRRNGWRLHAVGSDPPHVHEIVSWRTFKRYEDVVQRIKGNISFVLGRDAGPRGQRWFTRGQGERRVFDRPHFDHLVGRYLPDHRGVFWREGRPLPWGLPNRRADGGNRESTRI